MVEAGGAGRERVVSRFRGPALAEWQVVLIGSALVGVPLDEDLGPGVVLQGLGVLFDGLGVLRTDVGLVVFEVDIPQRHGRGEFAWPHGSARHRPRRSRGHRWALSGSGAFTPPTGR